MYMANARKKQKWSLYGSLSLLEKRQITEGFFSKSSGKTESGHPIRMFLSKAGKNVTLVFNLNRHFVF